MLKNKKIGEKKLRTENCQGSDPVIKLLSFILILQGTLALEDALSLGLPIRAEVDTLHMSVEGIDKDSLLHLVLSSLPEEVLNYGTDTYLQLNQKASVRPYYYCY